MGGFISISEKSSWLKALTASMFALRRRLLRARRSHRPRAAAERGRETGRGRGRRRAAKLEVGQKEAETRRRGGRLRQGQRRRGGGPPFSPVRRMRKKRRRRRWTPTCPFGGGGCALGLADTAPSALTHWPTLARPVSGRASLSPSRQRDGGSGPSPRRAGHPGTARASQRFLCPAPAPSRPARAGPAPVPPRAPRPACRVAGAGA